MTTKKTLAEERRRRKLITSLWVLGLSIVVIVLIYKELTAVLYILATLGVTALLVVVATSDLTHLDRAGSQSPMATDAKESTALK